jgi:hypothetical protein
MAFRICSATFPAPEEPARGFRPSPAPWPCSKGRRSRSFRIGGSGSRRVEVCASSPTARACARTRGWCYCLTTNSNPVSTGSRRPQQGSSQPPRSSRRWSCSCFEHPSCPRPRTSDRALKAGTGLGPLLRPESAGDSPAHHVGFLATEQPLGRAVAPQVRAGPRRAHQPV